MCGIIEDITPLILDSLERAEAQLRTCADAMDAWRASRPRLTVREDSLDPSLITRRPEMRRGAFVALTTDRFALPARKNRPLPSAGCAANHAAIVQ